MSWVLLTLLAVNLWAITAIIDKYLIGKHIKNPFTYIGIGSIPTLVYTAILILTFGLSVPNLLYGLLAFLTGLLLACIFFLYVKALTAEEVSRVIPLYSMATIFTLILATIFLNEVFTSGKYIGILLLILGSFFISYKHHKSKGKFSKAFAIMTLISFLYAVVYVIVKYLSTYMTSMSIFILSEFGLFIGGSMMFIASIKEIRKLFSKNKKIISFRILSGLLAFIGYLVYYAALSQGPASLITALDLTEAFFVLVYATVISIFIPRILKEEVSGSIIILKILAIVLMFVGGYLISV